MSTNRPRVSIGLPVFNGEDYLEQALEAILAQSYTDFELIISDNASIDKTRGICQKYMAEDPRIHYSRNQINIGVDRNFNRVFDLSRGEYFKWSAHDDLIAPEFLEQCVDVLDREPRAIMCYPKTIIINEHGSILEYLEDLYDLRSPKTHVRFHHSFKASGWCHPAFGLIRSEVLRRVGPMASHASSDKVLHGELALHGQCHEIPEYLAYLRIHPKISTLANTTDEELARWIDPLSDGKVPAPRWWQFKEHIKAIKRSPCRPYEKLLCYLQLARFYLSFGRLT